MKIDLKKAKEEQNRLAKEVIIRDEFTKLKYIAGTCQITTDNKIISVIVVMESPSMKFVESKYTIAEIDTPFVSGFRSYREMPFILKTYEKLEQKPDLIIVDGHGKLHPRQFGIASHLGMALNIPTIGVAKKLILGEVKSGKVYLGNDHCGLELKTKEAANPIFVSPGHKVSMGSSLRIVRDAIILPHKMPEPVHVAHKFAVKLKKR